MLVELNVSTLRNINEIKIKPYSGINLIIGPNGSGKTSLLEAIHLLALGKSFRTRLLKAVIQLEQDSFQVTGKLNKHHIPVGLQFDSKSGLMMRFNNAPLKRLSDLAKQLPLQNIPANSHQFFEQGPRFRRQLLDWSLFHVEQSFNYHWLSYKKTLQQRNAALKNKKSEKEVTLWNELLVLHGEKLNQFRQKHLSEIEPDLIKTFQIICPEFNEMKIDLKFSSGWAVDKTLAESLELGLQRDKQLTYTRSGPHRADWSVRINDVDATAMFSRGQQKLFFLALCFVQIKLNQRLGNTAGVLLIDDLNSELDQSHLALVLEQLTTLPVQSFISSTGSAIQDELGNNKVEHEVFHVKQGELV